MYKRISPHLVKKAKDSEESFEKLMKQAERIIYHFAYSSGIRSLSIDDVIQEGRVVVWRCVKKYDSKMNVLFSTYLIKSLKNRFGSKRGAENTDKRIISLKSESLSKIVDEGSSIIDHIVDDKYERFADRRSAKIFIQELMDILPPDGYMLCRFILREMTLMDIAKRMKTTESKVKVMFNSSVRKHIIEAKKYGIV